MFCPQCRAENAATNRFCIRCGAPLPQTASPTASPAQTAAPPTPPAGPTVAPLPAAPAAPPPAVTAPHFARTGTVLVIGAVAAVIIFLIVLAAGAVLVLSAASHRGSTAGGIRPMPGGAPPAAPGPAVPPPAVPPSGGGGSAPQVTMQRYSAPNGVWSIDAPSTWHVKEAPNGAAAVFYYDDPDEGTALGVVPFQSVQGEGGSRDVLGVIVRGVQQHAPDFQVRINNVRDISSGDLRAETLEGDAAWTGGRGQAMLGHINLVTFFRPGSGTTTFLFFGGQSPAQVFPSARPVLDHMVNSFRSSHP